MGLPELPTRPAPPASESSFGGTVHTPPSYANTIADDNGGPVLWDGRVAAVPWPDNVYMILEKSSGRALTVAQGGRLVLQDPPPSVNEGYVTNASSNGANAQWLCVESRGYFALHNPKTGKYLGHDGKKGLRVGAKEPDAWERLMPRRRPEGGYQIMVPQEGYSMWMVTVAEDGKGLALRHHGTTLWEFVKV